MANRALVSALLAVALSSAAFGDIIELTDGRKFSGSLVRSGDVITIKSDDGKTVNVKPADIAKVTLISNVTPEEAAANEWGRIPGQVKTASDLKSVIDLYQKFIEKYPDAKQLDEARSKLAIYQAMTGQDPVNFRGRWMPRAQIDAVLKQWADDARPALDLYKAGRLKEAIDAVLPVIQADNQNPDAITIAGLAWYRQNNLPSARMQFANLAAADPGSVLAENNLAVVSTGQKQLGEAMVHYTKAIQLAPDNRLVLDNTAEALNTYLTGGGDKNSAAYRTLDKAFEPAELQMEATMAKAGMIRWGATWVTRDQKARLDATQNALADMMGKLDAQYNTIRRTLADIESQIRRAQADAATDAQIVNTSSALILSSAGIDVDVAFYASQRDLAGQNYDRLQHYIGQLETEHDQLVAGTRDYIAQAEKLKAAFAAGGMAGQYTGSQRIMDWGEAQNPPAPTPVVQPAIPDVQVPPIIITPPPAPSPPVLIPIPVNPPILVPVNPNPGRGG